MRRRGAEGFRKGGPCPPLRFRSSARCAGFASPAGTTSTASMSASTSWPPSWKRPTAQIQGRRGLRNAAP